MILLGPALAGFMYVFCSYGIYKLIEDKPTRVVVINNKTVE
jgi:hypothetical protein